MKSKISCFNKTIFKKNLTHFWPLWLAYAGYMIIVLPASIWQKMSITYVDDYYSVSSRQLSNISTVLGNALNPFGVFIFAVAAVMAVFSYLYSPKNANMIHSLPVNRKELFITNFLSEFVFMVIPEVIAFIAAVFVCLGYRITSIEYLFLWLIYIIGMTFFALAFATFVAMLTGQLLAVPVYFFVANYLFVGCLNIVSSLINTICYGITNAWRPGKSCILSPIYYLNNNLRCARIYNEAGDQIIGIGIKGGHLILYYSIAAVVILFLAYQLYRKRQIETAGDLISISYVKPVFRWGVALCTSFLVSVTVVGIFRENTMEKCSFIALVIGVIVIGFFAFFGAEMLLQKNFRVFKKKCIIEWAAMMLVSVAIMGVFKLDVFGVERKIPDIAEVEKCYISLDYPICFEGEEAAEVIELHKQMIEEKSSVLDYISDSGRCYYAEIRYLLKDGSILERCYPVPVAEEYLNDENAIVSKVAALELDKENLLQNVFGVNYESNEYYSGHLELYDSEGNYDTYRFGEDELDKIIDAIMADIDAGNYGWYMVYSTNSSDTRERGEYFNAISLSFYNENGIEYTVDDFYGSDIIEYTADDIIYSNNNKSSSSSYICFGEKCVNIVNTLEELGVINDEWKLYTYEEYEKLNKW